MHRTWLVLSSARAAPESAGQRSPRIRNFFARNPWIFEESNHCTIEMALLNRLWGADAVQLWWTIRRHDK
jgi:hypothetical protein